ncbi:hypothetical protein Tco_0960671 [Tanacetum coccineum]
MWVKESRIDDDGILDVLSLESSVDATATSSSVFGTTKGPPAIVLFTVKVDDPGATSKTVTNVGAAAAADLEVE